MVEKNYAGQLDVCWNLFSMFWRCICGLCLRIKPLFSLNANLLDYCWGNLFSESMILLFWYTESIMTIRTCVFGTWIFSQSTEAILIHISKKNLPRNQPDINFLVVEKLSCSHLMNFLHMHQLTCLNSSTSFFSVKKIRMQSLVLNDDVSCSVPLKKKLSAQFL